MTTLPADTERLVALIARMDRNQLQKELLHFQGSVRLDFTEDFLRKQSIEQLRHILLAARLQKPYN